MTARCHATIDVRTAIANYPVPVGGVLELRSVGHPQPARLRIFVVQRVSWRSVIAYVGEEGLEMDHFNPRFGLLMRFSFSEVVLLFRYFFFHPIGWYVILLFYLVDYKLIILLIGLFPCGFIYG